jgi:hypothetical protein
MKIPREVRELESLIKVNKHLGIALSELTKTHSYIGSLREQKKLIGVKLKLEGVIERTLMAEKLAKGSFFRKLK